MARMLDDFEEMCEMEKREMKRIHPLLKGLILQEWERKVDEAKRQGRTQVPLFTYTDSDYVVEGKIVKRSGYDEYPNVTSIKSLLYTYGRDLFRELDEAVYPCYTLHPHLLMYQEEDRDDGKEWFPELYDDTSAKCSIRQTSISVCWNPDREKYWGNTVEECPICNDLTTIIQSFHRAGKGRNKRGHWGCGKCVSRLTKFSTFANCPFCNERSIVSLTGTHDLEENYIEDEEEERMRE